MAELLSKSSGNNQIGKQRVYLIRHPEDPEGLFDKVTDELLILQKCAIFYRNPSETYSREEIETWMESFQLVVVLVTEAFLLQPDETCRREIALAVKYHIPLLPIMETQGLDESYEAIFGRLQYLARHNRDETEIPYEKRLFEYLKNVMTNDRLAEQVRSVFDIHMFLSYRKKDRAQAQDFMQMVHKNELLRGVAFWYDEYLIPGEDFSEGIREAIEKCDIFTLVVTPNLVNEDNYVMREEYPLAKKVKKDRIIAAELLATNRKMLRWKYWGIPECIDPRDREALVKKLEPYLKNSQVPDKALGEEKPDHLKTYLLGLAYLSGIDVEVNHSFAVKLITKAADAGLPEAMKKLSQMYRYGHGVDIQRRVALSWMEKYVDALFREEDPSWTEELQKLETFYAEEGMLEDAIEACQYCMDAVENPLKSGILAARMSNYYRKMGKTAEAGRFARKCLELARSFDGLRSFESIALASSGYEKIGDLERDQGRDQEAYNNYVQSYKLKRMLMKSKPDRVPTASVIATLDRLVNACIALGSEELAVKLAQLQLLETETQMNEERSVESTRNMLCYMDNQSRIFIMRDEEQKALLFMERLVQEWKQLMGRTALDQDSYHYAISCLNLHIFHYTKSGDTKKDELIEACRILGDLYRKHPEIKNYRESYAKAVQYMKWAGL